jgi:hypothetical protein
VWSYRVKHKFNKWREKRAAEGGARLGPSEAFRQQHAKFAEEYPKDYARRM